MSTINRFVTNAKDGFAKSNLFRCTFVGCPETMEDQEASEMFIKSVQIPQDTLTTIDQYKNNKNYQVINGRDFDSISITFMLLNKQNPVSWMERWFQRICSPYNQFLINYKDNYTCNYLLVEQLSNRRKPGESLIDLDGELQPTAIYKFHDIYPVNKSISQFGYDQDNSITELTINFQFDWYEIAVGIVDQGQNNEFLNFARASIPSIGQINTLRKIF